MNSLTELSQYIESKPDKQCVIWGIIELLNTIEEVKKEYKISDEDIYAEKYYRK